MTTQVTVSKWLWAFTGQAAHMGCACALMEAFRLHTSLHTSIIILVIGLGLAAIKEFWYDYKFETVIERGSSLLDFSMYTVGLLLGFFVG